MNNTTLEYPGDTSKIIYFIVFTERFTDQFLFYTQSRF